MRRIACIRLLKSDCNLQIDHCKLQAIERCGRFSPIVGLEPNDNESLLLDISGLAHLFGGEIAMAEAMVRDFARSGQTVRLAIADTIGAAWAVVKYCDLQFSPFLIVPPGETAAFLNPLPIESLRLSEDTVRLLHELGILRIGQLEALPREEFLSRFEPALLQRMDQAFGRLDEPVPACPMPPKFETDWSAEYPTTGRETIEAVLEHLIRRVAAMLGRCGRGVLRLECRLELEIEKSPTKFKHPLLSVGLFRPTAGAEHLFQLVQLQMDRLRIPAPVANVCVAATLTAPLEPHRQAMLFDLSGNGRGREQPHQLAMLVERLSSRLGNDAVARVRLRPEAQPELSWHYDSLVEHGRRRRAVHERRGRRRFSTEVLASIENSPSKTTSVPSPFVPPRPLRLLMRPLPVGVTSIAPDGPPLRFRFAGRQHDVARSWGPERIETGWWRGRPVGRDYFRVETAAGYRFWLFRRLRDEKWFLHGMFE